MVVLVDNEKDDDLTPSWGLSIYIERGNFRLLFDTGDDPNVLKENAEKLNINISKIDSLIFSHNHYDHTGGFPYIVEKVRGIPVYIPERIMAKKVEKYGFKPVFIKRVKEIQPGFTLYRFEGGIPEQSLIVEGDNKTFLVVGCSHLRIENMVREIMENQDVKIHGVIGGFHLYTEGIERFKRIKNAFIDLGIEEIYPIHCTGKKAREFFSKELKEIYKGGREGTTIEF